MDHPNRSEEMLKYVPGYYRGSRYYLSQNEAKGREFDIIRTIMEDLPNQFYPQTATWGIKYWEEFLDIEYIPGQSLQTRRMNVLKKYSDVRKVTPISMERMIWAIARARVDIIRNVAPYVFKVQLREESLDADISAIREVVEEYKEAHLAYLIAIFLGTIQTGEKFVPRVTHRMRVFWYTDWILNGWHDLDGSKLLDANFPPYYRVKKRLTVAHSERFEGAAVGHRMRMPLRETFWASVKNLFVFYWWGDYNHLLNGHYPLDGSYLLNTVFPPYAARSFHLLSVRHLERFDMRSMLIKAMVTNTLHAHMQSVQRVKMYWWGDFKGLLNGRYDLDGELGLDNVLVPYETMTTHRFSLENQEEFGASVTIKQNLWRLDGEYSLDGSKKLNAYEAKEEL